MIQPFKSHRGFTLIEILIVIGLIAVLATVVVVAINPARQFAQARNSQRYSNVNTILNGIGQRIADNKGLFSGSYTVGSTVYTCPTLIPDTDYNITSSSGSANINLVCLIPTYIPTMLPFDPSATGAHWSSVSDYDSKYHAKVDINGRYTISAPSSELGQTISVTR